VISSEDFLILYIGTTFSGKNHDYNMFKKEFDPNMDWFLSLNILVDSGYQGFNHDYETNDLKIPYKKPRKSKSNPNPELTKDQKEKNKAMSKERVVVENVIGGMKRFRCISDRYRNHIDELKDLFIFISAGLWNFNLSCRG
jgi:hypothetical protein